MILFHGSNQSFDKFSQSKARLLNDYYGGGVAYFTNDPKVAQTYAVSMVRKYGGDRYIYNVDLRFKKMFDVDEKFTGKELSKFFTGRSEIEAFARGASLLSYNSDKYAVMGALELGHMTLTGEQVFKGLSRGMNQTAAARSVLVKLGYDTLRYNGGSNMGAAKHNVYITYKPDNVLIKQKHIMNKEGEVIPPFKGF